MAKRVRGAKLAGAPKPEMPDPITTQRAYTLRLRGDEANEGGWRDALWATHEAINNGAKVFGDWLLTLRGGLSHELAEPPTSGKGKKRTAEEAADLRKGRRILLALSWLSVEDERGSARHHAHVVAYGADCRKRQDSDEQRNTKVVAALRDVLRGRGIGKGEIESWVADCQDSLCAQIRGDAVWVNRSAVFDSQAKEMKGLSRDYAQSIIMSFFGPVDEYFRLPDIASDEAAAGGGMVEGPEFRTLARQWMSTNFGSGDKSDISRIVKSLRVLGKADLSRFEGGRRTDLLAALAKQVGGPTHDTDGIRIGVGWSTGRPSKGRLAVENIPDRVTKASIETLQKKLTEEADDKESKAALRDVPGWMQAFRERVEGACALPFVGDRDHIGEFSVMLDHAARRVSIGHSWIKRAEAERRRFEADVQRLTKVPSDAARWLDGFTAQRSGTSGAAAAGGEYRIRRRAIQGWDEIVKKWKRAACKTSDDRIAAARELQSDPEIEKFGDIQLFEALAVDEAKCVWHPEGKADAEPLKDYVAGHDARLKRMRFKVPAYRHPDPLRHPVFGDFGNSRWEIEYGVHEASKVLRGERRAPTKGSDDEKRLADSRSLRMGLWDGERVRGVDLRWSSKRLAKDLGIDQPPPGEATAAVTRADRLGRAASGLPVDACAAPAGLFDQKEWNGRLQAPRRRLDELARHVERHGWDARAKEMREGLPWLVTFSAKLECRGPFIGYAAANGITPNRKGEYYPNSDVNKSEKREGHAKLILSRLPGLRVLSVDLGHRYAAACAVWHTVSATEFKKEIAGREVVSGAPSASSVYCHTRYLDPKAGKPRTTIYRRIGNDALSDKSANAAPWARLDRQFLIKLQGEEKPARKAAQAEHDRVREIEADLGRVRDKNEPLSWRIDELMSEAIRTVRLALRRHGDAARIAYAFMPDSKRHSPGGGTSEHTPESRRDAILDALIRWRDLCGEGPSSRWHDPKATEAWEKFIQVLLREELPDDEDSGVSRKRRRAMLEQALNPAATELAKTKSGGQPAIHGWWAGYWSERDGQWRPMLRELSRWLLPRGLRATRNESDAQAEARRVRLAAARNVGGLSLTRIATVRELWQVQKAYHYKPRPEDPRAGVRQMERDSAEGRKFGDRALRAMERMREQRVKQIASRIVEAALGVGRHKPARGKQRDPKRLLEQVDASCHAIVIENLRNYRPEEVQARRENKALMNWSAGKVRKYLEEGCQLHGLHLREVMPNYTSRQCSRTGRPGVRCQDVPVCPESGEPKAFWWNRALASATDKQGAESRFLVELDAMLKDPGCERPATVRVPRRGGDLFVAADGNGAALQADLNAAANIGLRALLDPDFLGKWWYVPCDTATGKPAKDKCGGSQCPILTGVQLESVQQQDGKGKVREKANAWRDIGSSQGWLPHAAYWNGVQDRAVRVLRVANGLT